MWGSLRTETVYKSLQSILKIMVSCKISENRITRFNSWASVVLLKIYTRFYIVISVFQAYQLPFPYDCALECAFSAFHYFRQSIKELKAYEYMDGEEAQILSSARPPDPTDVISFSGDR